jgi:hypothetical protein
VLDRDANAGAFVGPSVTQPRQRFGVWSAVLVFQLIECWPTQFQQSSKAFLRQVSAFPFVEYC